MDAQIQRSISQDIASCQKQMAPASYHILGQLVAKHKNQMIIKIVGGNLSVCKRKVILSPVDFH